jgi:predicted  nucleic acid-binding Zn-ribbon protein
MGVVRHRWLGVLCFRPKNKLMKNQKGFIPIIFIIIGAITIASVTFGVVKYRDEITASVVSIFKKSEVEIPNTELTGESEGIEEPVMAEPTDKIQEQKSNEEQTNARRLQEQLRTAEQKRLEAEKRLAEEKARQEAERAKAEAEKLKVEQAETKTDQAKEEKKATNIAAIDKELSQIISEIQQRINIFSQAKNEAKTFIPTVRETMNKYSGYSSIQQSGQQLINELNNLSFVVGKLLDIENDRIRVMSSFLGSGKVTSSDSFSFSKAEYENYRSQYDLYNNNIKSLTEAFVLNEKKVLEEILAVKQKELEELKKLEDQFITKAKETDSQLAELDRQIEQVYQKIEDEKNRLASMEIIAARINKIKNEELYPLLAQRDALLGKSTSVYYPYKSTYLHMTPNGSGGYTIYDDYGSIYLHMSSDGSGGYTIYGY